MSIHKYIFLVLIIISITSPIYSQTFNVSDTFPKRSNERISNEKTLFIDAYIINMITEKEGNTYIVKGNISDINDSTGIWGVQIFEKDTRNISITDSDGNFLIRTTQNSPTLSISTVGFRREDIVAPDANGNSSDDSNKPLNKFHGLLVSSFGSESIIQPNIMFTHSWEIKKRHGVELRFLGFQSSKDTDRTVNGLNLIKPEISKFNFNLSGQYIPLKKSDNLLLNAELNIFRQQLNQQNLTTASTQSNDITSMLTKLSVGFRPTDGLSFFLSGVHYNVFEGVQFYEDRFGDNTVKNFWNIDLSGKFYIDDGTLEGTFVQAMFNVNSKEYKRLLNTNDTGVFLIKIGFNTALLSNGN